MRKSVLYPLVGLLLSVAAPTGWFVIRLIPLALHFPQSFFTEAVEELSANALLYVYMHSISVLTLTLAGFALGWRDDRIRQHYQKVLSQRRLLSIKNRQLARLSITDNLTGLANRARLMDMLAIEFKRTQRYGSDLCVLLVDIDHFKRINDTHGHLFGDYVLHELGQIFASSRRETDYVARTGGEEFCFLLTQTHMNDALKFAERLRETVDAYKFDFRGVRIQVRLSAGIASIQDLLPSEFDDKGQRLYNKADEALYMAKRLGRNRVVRYEQQPANVPISA